MLSYNQTKCLASAIQVLNYHVVSVLKTLWYSRDPGMTLLDIDHISPPDIDGALIIAEQEELAGNNVTLDYVINENGTCTCKLCGEITQSRTHWYRHKYKVKLKKRIFESC